MGKIKWGRGFWVELPVVVVGGGLESGRCDER